MTWVDFISSPRPGYRIARHAVLWTIFLLWLVLLSDIWIIKFTSHIPPLYGRILLYCFSTYFTLYFLIPRYFHTGRYQVLIMYLLVLALLYPLLSALLIRIFTPDHFENMNTYLLVKVSLWDGWGLAIATSAFATCLKLIKDLLLENIEHAYLRQHKTSQEMQLLKSQLNARFLARSLKSIENLSAQQSARAPQLVMNLSNLLSYTLYESDDATVKIAKEVELIEDYLALQCEINKGLRVDVFWSVSGEACICPLILLPLVESLFDRESVRYKALSSFRIDTSLSGADLQVKIEGQRLGHFRQNALENNFHYRNVLHRLRLHYANAHQLEIRGGKSSFGMDLRLTLAA